MYTVYLDGELMHDVRLKELYLHDPKLSHELNKAGSFTFTIYPAHARIGKIKKMKPILTINDESGVIWRGRILNTTRGFYNQLACTCEGEMAFLNDSRIRTYDYEGGLAGYFTFLITQHNEQVDASRQFKVGTITVTDPNDYIHYSSTQLPKTLDELNNKLINKYGGYVWFRHEADGVYVDYLKDSNLISNQVIEFGNNLLDFSEVVKGQDVATVIIPMGAEIENEEGTSTGARVDITSVNEGKDYVVNEEAAALFDYITTVVYWDDVTEPENLLRKAKEYIADAGQIAGSITLTAANLHCLNLDINNFRLFRYVKVKSAAHNIDDYYLVNKIDINLVNPADSKLSIGTSYRTLTDKQVDSDHKQSILVSQVESISRENSDAQIVLREDIGSDIDQTKESIKQTVYDNVYRKDETDDLIESVSTEVEQTKDAWQVMFNKFETDLGDVAKGSDAAFEEIRQYIRFEDGNILLGNSESPLVLKIRNDRIQFLQNGYEVAYIADQRLYNTVVEVKNKLIIGNSAWILESNGSVSLVGI